VDHGRNAGYPVGPGLGGSVHWHWHWHSRAPVASYLVENSVGNYSLTSRIASDGIRYYQAQDTSISAAQQQDNLAIMNQQPDITDFESQFNGPFPFTSDGIIIGTPEAGFEEEMQTMITFASGEIDLGILYHENMHQWWGDNVTEGGYNLTFFKEGMATLGEYLQTARDAETKAGGPGTAAGRKAFQDSLIAQFNKTYARAGSFWTAAPSNPTPFDLFSNAPTYERPAAAYIALWQILGTARFTKALQQIQRHYVAATSPNRSSKPASGTGCRTRARPAKAGSASSSPSGSTPPTPAGAAPASPLSPGRVWPDLASTTAAAAARARAGSSAPGSAADVPEPGDGLPLGRGVGAFA
jgi:Peptidase family M1 domain